MPVCRVIGAVSLGDQIRCWGEDAAYVNIVRTQATNRGKMLEESWRDQAIAVRFEDPRRSAESLAEAVRPLAIAGIAAVADRPTLIAALTAEKLGLPWHPPQA